MAELTEQEQIRRNSLNELKKLGINPYPAALYEVNVKSSEILEKYPLMIFAVASNHISMMRESMGYL